jgi:hypothetical protein
VPFAAGDERLRVVGVADEGQRAVEAGAAVGLAGQAFEQQGVVALVGLGLAGEARRQHAGRAAEDVDAQPGVVGQGRQAGGAGGVAGLGDGVLDEAGWGSSASLTLKADCGSTSMPSGASRRRVP